MQALTGSLSLSYCTVQGIQPAPYFCRCAAAWNNYPNAMKLLCIAMTVVLRTVECERFISILNDIKTPERSR